MTVVIQQGKAKVIAMPGIFVGESEEKNAEIAKAQKEYYKERPESILLMTKEEEEDLLKGIFE